MKKFFIFTLALFLSTLFSQLCLASTVDLNEDVEVNAFDVGCDVVDMEVLKTIEVPTVQGQTVLRVASLQTVSKIATHQLQFSMTDFKLNATADYAKPNDWTRVIWRHSFKTV